MKRMLTAVLSVALVAVAGIIPAAADQVVGAFSISGNFAWVDNDTGAQVNVLVSDAIDFRPFTNVANPGDPGQFLVLNASGDFTSFIGFSSVGTIEDITFIGAGNTDFPAVPVASFQVIGGFTFDLLAIDSIQPNGAGSLDIFGHGVFNVPGFDPTPGEFKFTGQQSGGSFSFSASQSTVPEPATVLLLGSGLVAAGVFARKRR